MFLIHLIVYNMLPLISKKIVILIFNNLKTLFPLDSGLLVNVTQVKCVTLTSNLFCGGCNMLRNFFVDNKTLLMCPLKKKQKQLHTY